MIDNSSYYRRTGDFKKNMVFEFIQDSNDINVIYDVGCNNGNISYPLQHKLGKTVMGTDLADGLNYPSDFHFKKRNIITTNDIVYNDCTLFLSIYHHILGKYGLATADDVFLKLLLRSKYLIFDTGNISESTRNNHHWFKIQKSLFNSEDDLLNHFHLPYVVLGKWNVAGGHRTVVLFSKKGFDNTCDVLGEFKRKSGKEYQCDGLVDINDDINNLDNLYHHTLFKKLRWNDVILFSKKRMKLHTLREINEIENIVHIYKNIDSSNLITYYGFSDTYGLIYEWLDDFKYIGKTKLDKFDDVDVILTSNGNKKYIDFER